MSSSSGQKSPNSSRGSEVGIVPCASFNSSVEGCPADAYFCSIVAINPVHIRQSSQMCGPPYAPITRCSTQNDAYAMIAAAGIVSTHAPTMFRAMPHRTAFMR